MGKRAVLVGVLVGVAWCAAGAVFAQGEPAGPAADGGLMELLDAAAGGNNVDELRVLLEFLVRAAGAVLSGAVLAYHPLYLKRVTGLLQMDAPKIILTYSVVGALVGRVAMISQAMGFVFFGIGGLMRFRTELPSAKDTGRAILATTIGITWGVGLLWVATVATVIAWLLILVLDWRIGYRLALRGVETSDIDAVAAAHQGVLEAYNCQITQVRKNPRKNQVAIVFKAHRRYDREDFEAAFEQDIEEKLRATVDWPEEG